MKKIKEERLQKLEEVLETHKGEKHLITIWYYMINNSMPKKYRFRAVRQLSMYLRTINKSTRLIIDKEELCFATGDRSTIKKIFYEVKV